MELRAIGNTGVQVTPLGFGTSPLGSMPETYGHEVTADRADATLHAMFTSPVTLIDTSRNYGDGRAEERIGRALAERPGVIAEGGEVVLATKLDREPGTGRFDRSRARRSLEESLDALGLDRVPILHLHDPEHAADPDEITADGGAMDELFRMRDEGLADAVGLAMGRLDMMEPLVDRYDFDIILNHNRYTVLNRSANRLFTTAAQRGVAVFNAAPYAGGVLAKGSDRVRRVTYQEADAAALAPVQRVEELCRRHQVPPGAVALQFSMRDPRITSTIVGVSRPERVAQTLDWVDHPIPDELWGELESLGYDTDDPEAGRGSIPGS